MSMFNLAPARCDEVKEKPDLAHVRDEGVHGDATGRKSSTLNLLRWAGILIRHMHIAKHDAMWIVFTGR
jgi:hypothetical protein